MSAEQLALQMVPELIELGVALIKNESEAIKLANLKAARKAKRLALKMRK